MNGELTKYLDKKFQKVNKEFLGVNEKFEKIDGEFFAIKEDLGEARKERQILSQKISDTYNAVDGFIKIVTKLDQ